MLCHAGWSEAVIAFAHGGGYHLRSQMSKVTVQTLILWGRNDNFVNPKVAVKFEQNLKNCQVVWLERCGHCASVEHPALVAELLLRFVSDGLPVRQ